MAGGGPKQYRQPEGLDLRALATVGGGAGKPKGLRAATRQAEAERLEAEAGDAEARFEREAVEVDAHALGPRSPAPEPNRAPSPLRAPARPPTSPRAPPLPPLLPPRHTASVEPCPDTSSLLLVVPPGLAPLTSPPSFPALWPQGPTATRTVNSSTVGKASGRSWKQPARKSSSHVVKYGGNKKDWAMHMEKKAQDKQWREQVREISREKREKIEAEKERREAKAKRKEINTMRSGMKLQKVNAQKIKKMSKKQYKKTVFVRADPDQIPEFTKPKQ